MTLVKSEIMLRLGAMSAFDESWILKLYESGFRVFQYMIDHAPTEEQFFQMAAYYRHVYASLPKDITLIAHGPFWLNFVKGNEQTERTVKWVKLHIQLLQKIGTKHYVVHPGYYISEEEIKRGVTRTRDSAIESWKNCIAEMQPFLEQYEVNLCFENVAGSKKDTQIGRVSEVMEASSNSKTPNVKFCFDSEHSWAYGEDIFEEGNLEKFDSVIKAASVIHLNAAPPEAPYGSNKDRHSKNLILDGVFPVQRNLTLRAFLLSTCPMILERDEMSICINDRNQLEQWLVSNGVS
jgi:endonuclease IV